MKSNTRDGGVVANSGAALWQFDQLPENVRLAAKNAEYDWYPGYIAELVHDIGPARAIEQLAQDDYWQHKLVAQKERRVIFDKTGKRIT